MSVKKTKYAGDLTGLYLCQLITGALKSVAIKVLIYNILVYFSCRPH